MNKTDKFIQQCGLIFNIKETKFMSATKIIESNKWLVFGGGNIEEIWKCIYAYLGIQINSKTTTQVGSV